MAKTKIIHKPNELIAILPSPEQRISGTMRLIYNGIILFSQHMGKQSEYVAVLNDLLSLCNLSSDFRTIKKTFKDIRRIDFEWRYVDDSIDEVRILGLIDEPRFITRKGHPTLVTWKLNQVIQERLLDPAMFFTRVNLEMMTKLTRSGASLAVYEICARYLTNNQSGGPGRTGKHSVEWWLPRIVGSHDYKPEYKFFKRDFLKPAINEINSLTDLHVEMHEYKIGKSVKEIEFTIEKKNSEIRPSSIKVDDNQVGDETSLFDRVINLGIKPESALKILDKYNNHEYLRRHIDGLEIAYKKGKVNSPTAWLNTALANNWEHVANRDAPKRTRATTKTSKTSKQDIYKEPPQNRFFPPEQIFSEEEKMRAIKKYDEFDENVKDDLIKSFLEETNLLVREEYTKKKMKSAIFRTMFFQWVIAKLS